MTHRDYTTIIYGKTLVISFRLQENIRTQRRTSMKYFHVMNIIVQKNLKYAILVQFFSIKSIERNDDFAGNLLT